MAGPYSLDREPASQQDTDVVRQGLDAYNVPFAGEDHFQRLTLLVRDESGAVAGGLLGGTYWQWLYVEILWLREDVRHQGWGSRLLAEAEQTARDRGCIGMHLDTMSFQALGFYQRHGFEVFGTLDDLPPGHQRFFLSKRLAQNG